MKGKNIFTCRCLAVPAKPEPQPLHDLVIVPPTTDYDTRSSLPRCYHRPFRRHRRGSGLILSGPGDSHCWRDGCLTDCFPFHPLASMNLKITNPNIKPRLHKLTIYRKEVSKDKTLPISVVLNCNFILLPRMYFLNKYSVMVLESYD